MNCSGTVHAELASIRQTHAELRAGQQRLKSICDGLASEQKQMEESLLIYQVALITCCPNKYFRW